MIHCDDAQTGCKGPALNTRVHTVCWCFFTCVWSEHKLWCTFPSWHFIWLNRGMKAEAKHHSEKTTPQRCPVCVQKTILSVCITASLNSTLLTFCFVLMCESCAVMYRFYFMNLWTCLLLQLLFGNCLFIVGSVSFRILCLLEGLCSELYKTSIVLRKHLNVLTLSLTHFLHVDLYARSKIMSLLCACVCVW